MSSSGEPDPLGEAVLHNLRLSGGLQRIQACIRAEVSKALHDPASAPARPATGKHERHLLDALTAEYLQAQYPFTASVFEVEAGIRDTTSVSADVAVGNSIADKILDAAVSEELGLAGGLPGHEPVMVPGGLPRGFVAEELGIRADQPLLLSLVQQAQRRQYDSVAPAALWQPTRTSAAASSAAASSAHAAHVSEAEFGRTAALCITGEAQ